MDWIKIENADIKGITKPISLENIERNNLGVFLSQYDKIVNDKILDIPGSNINCTQRYHKQLWYTESRQYLLDNGIFCCESQLPNDVCNYHELFWNDNIFTNEKLKDEKLNIKFLGTVAPILLTISNINNNEMDVIFWRINTVTNMSYRGCALKRVRRKQWGESC